MEEQLLFEAAMGGNIEILDGIRDHTTFAKQYSQGDTACHLALQRDHFEFARDIASRHPPILYTPNMRGDTVLHRALKIGQPKLFVQFVELIRRRRVNSLRLEAQRCNNSILDREHNSLVYLAAAKGYFEAVNILMKTPALSSTDGPRGSTALHAAVRHSHYGIVQLLMRIKKDLIVRPDQDMLTPMLVAVSLKNVKMCNLLLMEAGRNLKKIIIDGDNGISAFHLAAENDDFLEIFRLFAERCPRCYYVRNELRQNVLHTAVKEKALRIVKFITKDKELSSRMIKQCDNDGNTPLSLVSTSNDNEEMLNVLLASSVNVPPLNNGEEKAQRKAIENFHSGMLVTATLVLTVTFAAAFSLPGGYKSGGSNEGTATLIGSAAFKVFLVFDTISLLSSIVCVFSLIDISGPASFDRRLWSSAFLQIETKKYLRGAAFMLLMSLLFMLAAFVARIWAIIGSKCIWLTILIVGLTLVTAMYLGGVLNVESTDEEPFVLSEFLFDQLITRRKLARSRRNVLRAEVAGV